MIESDSYRLSLHISHPSLAASEIIQHFTISVAYSKSVGEKRKTKNGRELGGIYSKTDISFDVSGGVISNDDASLSEYIKQSFFRLPHNAIKDLVSSGGECFYLVGIYAEGNFFMYLPADLLSACSSASIGLKFDFYGGEDKAD